MSRYRKIEIFEPLPSLFVRETSFFTPPTLTFPSFSQVDDLSFDIDLFTPNPCAVDLSPHFPLPAAPPSTDIFDSITDLIQIEKTPISSSYKRYQTRMAPAEPDLRTICDRVSALELGFDRFVNEKTCNLDRKYSWTAEVKAADKDGIDRKYKWTAEIKGAKKGAKPGALEKNYKWTAEFKGKGKGKDAPLARSYTLTASTAPAADFDDSDSDSGKEKKKTKKKKESKAGSSKRVVEIEEPVDQRTLVRRQVSTI